MPSGISAALSALNAYGLKLQNNANNIANSNTESFKKGRVLLQETRPQGVRASAEKVLSAGPMIHEETSSGSTLVEQSNVDLAEEFPDMITTTNAYKANLKSLQAQQEMADSLLDLKT